MALRIVSPLQEKEEEIEEEEEEEEEEDGIVWLGGA